MEYQEGVDCILATNNNNGRPEGGSLQEKVKQDNRRPIRINNDFVMSDVRYKPLPPTTKKFRCCMCGNEWTTQKNNFLSGGKSPLWRANNGYLPFCKTCCEALMENMVAFYSGNEEHALKHLCRIFDWYYDETASAMTLAQVKAGSNRINYYPSKACTRQVATRGETYLDTVRDDFEASKVISSPDVDDVVDDYGSENFEVTKDMIRAWGPGFTKEQYQYLEEEYNDWINRHICKTKSQEEIYRNIVLAQLDIRTARQRGGKVTEAQKALQDLMSSANVLPKQTADNVIADTQTFGTLLKKFEETDPIPAADERWKDVDGIRKYVNTWFKGGLAKSLKITGIDNVALYEEAVKEMEKYTVHPNGGAEDSKKTAAELFGDVPDSQESGGDANGE